MAALANFRKFLLPLAALLLAVVLLTAGCGKEEAETISIKTDAGETVEAVVDGGDHFSAKEVGGTLSVYQEKKLMLRIAFITADQRAARIDNVKLMGGGQDFKEEGDTVSFVQAGKQGLIHVRIVPAGKGLYAIGATYLPDEAAEAVWKRIHFKEQ